MATYATTVRASGQLLVPTAPMAPRSPKPIRWNPGRITTIREAASLSPERVAELLNQQLPKGAAISGRKVRRWEAGDYFPNAQEIEALCRVFHADVAVFFSVD